MKRVVVTGMGGLSPLGCDWGTVGPKIRNKESAVIRKPEWAEIDGMACHLAAEVKDFQSSPKHWPRKKLRSMGRVGILSTRATELALEQSCLLDSDSLTNGQTGIAYGSTYGSPPTLMEFLQRAGMKKSVKGLTGSAFLKFMSHTCAANLAQFFEIKGRLIPTSCACASGAQAIGYAYETIRHGIHDIMVAGGADELHYFSAAVFDIMYATSTRNDNPTSTPAPFDRDRDGLIVGEGASTLVLESLEHAKKRGAPILAEVVGFATNCDGSHIVHPSFDGMTSVMKQSLQSAGLHPDAIGYVNAHGTATDVGDVAETKATRECFKREVPISSLKSYMGHTLGASGSIEAWLGIEMMNEGWIPPTMNLQNVDHECGQLDYVTEARDTTYDTFMSNNFAFGGVNVSLIFKKWA